MVSLILIAFIIDAIFFYAFRDYLPDDLPGPMSFVIIGFAMVLIMLFFWRPPREKGSYLADSYPRELDRMALSAQKESEELIFKKLGKEGFEQMLVEEFMNVDGTCLQWVGSKEVQADPDLKFYILAKLANVHIKEDNYDQAAACLEEALSLKPDNLLLNLRLAEVHEARGGGKEAIKAYQTALEHAYVANLQSYLRRQIERVKTKGPRKAAPMPGLRYVTY